MKPILFQVAVLLLVVLAACGTQEPVSLDGQEATKVALVGDPTTGESIYADKCVNCHGPEGGGGQARVLNPASASLQGDSEMAFNENLIQIITKGRGRMPAWGDTGRLTPQQIADVAAYILSLNQ